MGMLWFGVGLGVLLLIAKYGSYMLLTTKKITEVNPKTGKTETRYVQREVRRWLLWGEKSGVRDRINESTFLLFMVDVVGGYIGMHVLGAFGASIIAMVAMTAYTIACMVALTSHFIGDWGKKKLFKFLPKRHHKRRWAEC